MMTTIKLTPRTVAKAIGVSESSMKRWCDRGLIDFHTTAGGHRRISQTSVIEFLRKKSHGLVRPDLIGLPENMEMEHRSIEASGADFFEKLKTGDEDGVRQILFQLFLAGNSIASIGDQLISPSFQEIGIGWECGELEVYRERLACEITTRVLHDLRSLLPAPNADAPLALGGAPEKDSYALPTSLVEMVLIENGWRSRSLGSSLPLETLAAAAAENKPRLFWLSVSVIQSEAEFLERYNEFFAALPPDTFLVIGGNAIDGPIRQRMRFSGYGDNLVQLESLANAINPVSSSPNPR